MQCPLDYSLCRQTVTRYRLCGERVDRQVLERAYYNYQPTQVTDEKGRRQKTLFLLIVPGQADLVPGDRIFDGVGPELTPAQWSRFLPVTVAGVSEVQYVRPYLWEDQVCHTEAGRK